MSGDWWRLAGAVFHLVYGLTLWVLLIVGIATQDWWLFAPAAFLLAYERIGEVAA